MEQTKNNTVKEDSCLGIVRHDHKYLNASVGLAIGIRRNISNISTGAFGATMLCDISRQTVCRWEIITGDAILEYFGLDQTAIANPSSLPRPPKVQRLPLLSLWRRDKRHSAP